MYVTRECIERVGLMDETFFLYWEETDSGVRAKPTCGVGYAHNSVVSHVGGTTTGAVSKRAERSALAVYLPYRNQLHFVRRHHPGWFAWTVFVSFLRTSQYLAVGSTRNFVAAIQGLAADCAAGPGPPHRASQPAENELRLQRQDGALFRWVGARKRIEPSALRTGSTWQPIDNALSSACSNSSGVQPQGLSNSSTSRVKKMSHERG